MAGRLHGGPHPGLPLRPLGQGQAGLPGLQLSVVEDHGVGAGQQAAVGGQAAVGHTVAAAGIAGQLWGLAGEGPVPDEDGDCGLGRRSSPRGRSEQPQEPEGREKSRYRQAPQSPRPWSGAYPCTGHRKRGCLLGLTPGPILPAQASPKTRHSPALRIGSSQIIITREAGGSQITAAAARGCPEITAAPLHPAPPGNAVLSYAQEEGNQGIPSRPRPEVTYGIAAILTPPPPLALWLLRGGGYRKGAQPGSRTVSPTRLASGKAWR